MALPASAEGSSSDRNGVNTLKDLTPAETLLVEQQRPVLAQHDRSVPISVGNATTAAMLVAVS
ncbi:hypothetical protein JCM18916_3025 [Cutibacterium acnes JCM 18916]|nr:hypothetical protein JCM18916_3025 [Cutibacterium acnes JCM 18916]